MQRKDRAQCWPVELAVMTAVPVLWALVTRTAEPLQRGLCDGRSECSFYFLSLAVVSLSSGYPVGWPRSGGLQTKLNNGSGARRRESWEAFASFCMICLI